MTATASRRGFIRGIAGAAALGAGGCLSWGGGFGGSREKIRLAAVGISGQGFADWMAMVESGKAELAALCDCDRRRLDDVASNLRFAALAERDGIDLDKIPFYSDYRRLLDDAGILGIRALAVSTPNHTHAAIAIRAMRMGIHVYVETPLARTLKELDYFAKTARESGVVTQMGNQASADAGFRRGVETLQSGVIGDVREIHVWTGRPVWPQGSVGESLLSEYSDPIPEGLDWNAWLATAKERPYRELYHPFRWRGLFDFGNGALGDMGCHAMNLPFRGLELGICTAAELVSLEDASRTFFPSRSVVRLSYAPRMSAVRNAVLPAADVTWYEGGLLPPTEITEQLVSPADGGMGRIPESGCLAIGSDGILFSPGDFGLESFVALYGEAGVQPVSEHPACRDVARRIPRLDTDDDASRRTGAVPAPDAQCIEFLDAINGDGPVYGPEDSRCWSGIGHSVPLTEGILAGVAAQRFASVAGKSSAILNWDSASQEFDVKAANPLTRTYLRRGFEF